MARARYHPAAIRQTERFNGKLIGCTETSFAMAVDAATLGGLIVTEAQVRELSNERHPDPASPGLNQAQLVQVANRLHVKYVNMTDHNRNELIDAINQNRRVVAQLWYKAIGGTDIGHAIYIDRAARGKFYGVDPIKGKYGIWTYDAVFHGMRIFADKAGVNGLLWGMTRPTQWLSSNQKPTTVG